MSNDVRESDFFANVQNSPFGSPHLAATIPEQVISEIDLEVPIGPQMPVETYDFPDPKPDIENIELLVSQHEKEFYGIPDRGVIGEVVPTRESRLLGLAAILVNFEDYKHIKKLTKTQINARSHHLDDVRKVNGKEARIHEHLDGANAELLAVYVEKVAINDELIQILFAIRNHIPRRAATMSEAAYEQFADDALVVFAKDDVNTAIRERLAQLSKQTSSTKDA